MTGTENSKIMRHYGYEQRLNDIVDFCGAAESGALGEIGGWRKGKKLFSEIDYEKLAQYSDTRPIPVFDPASKEFKYIKGPSLKQSEVGNAIISAITEKEPERRKGGLKDVLITTNHILFQFYLMKVVLNAAAK